MAINTIFTKLFGDKQARKLKRYEKIILQVNALEPEMAALDDVALLAQTEKFKARLTQGETLAQLLPEAFATVREAAKRTLGLRPYDVQIMGGAILHEGNIAEMQTGEGKSLTATMPVYLNALTGRPVHIVTVNDYLAKRDAEAFNIVYAALGMRTSAIVPGMSEEQKSQAYKANIIYATNNELGFDYLRDNMKHNLETFYQKEHYFAIVDEVDSILIDEARQPLVLSGPQPDRSELYRKINEVIPLLEAAHYDLDEKSRSASLTDAGIDYLEDTMHARGLLDEGTSLYDPENTQLVHHVNMALLAHKAFHRDRHYIVKNGKAVLIDEFTGRVATGRRLSNGLHQALEAKEGIEIHPESVTIASITYQNYFRLYEKLAGMTGTAMTEAQEFAEIYGLETFVIPTNLPSTRKDLDDRIYRTEHEKFAAITEEVTLAHGRGQPVLIGTTSIEKSEKLSHALEAAHIPHNVLNARHHDKEAHIIAKAGLPGAVTIATNMAGRGTDIQLGGNMDDEIDAAISEGGDPVQIRAHFMENVAFAKEKAIAAGGLYVMGTERHESRRIDNQLRGRSGRQGDPGTTRFFLSLEDDLLRLFGGARMETAVSRLGLSEGEALEHRFLSRALINAQRKVEGRNFDVRKNLLKFDDVMNAQRKIIFGQRLEVLENTNLEKTLAAFRHEVATELAHEAIPEKSYVEQWDINQLKKQAHQMLNLQIPLEDWIQEPAMNEDTLIDRLQSLSDLLMTQKEEAYSKDVWNDVERQLLLGSIDKNWRDHLESLDHLRSVISFRGYAQRDPFIEYKTESFEMFEALLENVRDEVTMQISHIKLLTPEQAQEIEAQEQQNHARHQLQENPQLIQKPSDKTASSETAPLEQASKAPDQNPGPRIARNDPCPCGSGKKYKHCHGKLIQA